MKNDSKTVFEPTAEYKIGDKTAIVNRVFKEDTGGESIDDIIKKLMFSEIENNTKTIEKAWHLAVFVI